MLCWFLPSINMNQPKVYMCPALLDLPPTSHPIPPHRVVTQHQAELPVLYSNSPLVIYCTWDDVYISLLLSPFVPPFLPLLCPHKIYCFCNRLLSWKTWLKPRDVSNSSDKNKLWERPKWAFQRQCLSTRFTALENPPYSESIKSIALFVENPLLWVCTSPSSRRKWGCGCCPVSPQLGAWGAGSESGEMFWGHGEWEQLGQGPSTATCVGVIVSPSPGPGVAPAGRGTSLDLDPHSGAQSEESLWSESQGLGPSPVAQDLRGAPGVPTEVPTRVRESGLGICWSRGCKAFCTGEEWVRSRYLLIQRVQSLLYQWGVSLPACKWKNGCDIQ